MKTKNFEIWIECDGARVTECDTKEAEHMITTYIPSEAGKNFQIACTNMTGSDLGVTIFCDGIELQSHIVDKHGIPGTSQRIRGLSTRDNKIRPFIFSTLQLTDDDVALVDDHRQLWEQLGTIKVQAFRCEVLGKCDTGRVQSLVDLQHKPIHEKAKKAGAHVVTLGKPEGVITRERLNVRLIDPRTAPFAQFTWTYRPKAMLQAQGIIPLERAGSSSGNRQLKSESDDNEWDELIAEKAALEARLREIESLRRIKREPSPLRFVTGVAGEVIDLTLD